MHNLFINSYPRCSRKITQTRLSKPVEQWHENQEYKKVKEVVKKLCIDNDPAGHAVKPAGERIRTVRSEKAFQETLLTVKELRCLSSDIKRGKFTKN